MATLKYLLHKELKQFVRDSFMLRISIAFPLVIILVMPLVATMDVKDVNVAIVDDDNSSTSGHLVREIEASQYFKLAAMPKTYIQAMSLIDDGSVDVIMQIPSGMEKKVTRGENVEVFIAANAVNSTKGMMGSGYLNSIVSTFSSSLLSGSVSAPLDVEIQYRYNKHLNYRLFMVPAFLIMIMIAICGFLPTLNIVSEKEKGTIEQINVTPLSRLGFILSKIIFYGLLGLCIFTVAFVAGKLVYGIAPYGGYAIIYLAAVLFILFMAGFGLTVSNFSSTLQQAVFVMFFFMMIFVLMSGLFTPVRSMVTWAYDFTYLLASRYFVDIMRAVCLKGSALSDLGFEFAMLALFTILMDAVAIITYKKQN